MAGNQLPVIDEAKIRQLQDIADKFKAAFSVGPGGFSARFQAPAAAQTDTGFNQFLQNLDTEAQGTLKTFALINKTLDVTTRTLKGLFSTALSWGNKLVSLSVAGPFGFGQFARQATSQYLNAQSVGLTTGQWQAANSVYGARISGTDNIIQALAAARNDPIHPAYAGLMSLGINPNASVHHNLPAFLTQITGLLEQYQDSGTSQAILHAKGLGFISVADANQIMDNRYSLPLLNQQYSERSQYLDAAIGDGSQGWLQKVYSSLTYNADRLGNTLVKSLSNLAPAIIKFSDSITSGLEKFIRGENGKALFELVASGLNTLSDWLGSEQFQADLKTFADCIKTIVTALGQAIKWIAGKVPGVQLSGSGTGRDSAARELVNFGDKYLGGKLPGANRMTNQYTSYFSENAVYDNYQMPDGLKRNIKHFVVQMNDTAKLPKGLMSAIAQTESSWNPLAKNKQSGAAGLFQFIPATAAAYGLSEEDVFDPKKATQAAAKYLQNNMKRYNGDIAKTLTQYNGGQIDQDGNLSLKKETVDYLLKILPQVQGGLAQHPGIVPRLREASYALAGAPDNARATIQLDINQMPGSDISAQVKGMCSVQR
ncbi:lytic transglycosylase domain-containing protein [Erwiniaceae bacterium BAC15a-03b]|uniref:Lytic transglycosylase domain-containing protein n=1 Tax=Winslowiella arboricola TaxID=2978220 RepID=A0A9J6PRP1_9GAMM|nr:lytic transglycosylase domain-containing protein [Winslowiella arboricola]MCU5774726.1 lytic transglycosylase domain-containing protein [Winslowiella arboricola]MCU5780122.1 lytic transglycosylase domain-containing protein [Winslowiella arboricola]